MIDGAGQLVWKSPTAIAGASFPLLVPDQNVLYVGSTDGELHQLSLTDGRQTAVKQVGDGTATVGSPVYDGLAQVLYVGASDGMLYRYAVPFQPDIQGGGHGSCLHESEGSGATGARCPDIQGGAIGSWLAKAEFLARRRASRPPAGGFYEPRISKAMAW